MNGNVTVGSSGKPLPPPARDEKLPTLPPSDLDALGDVPPPPPPPGKGNRVTPSTATDNVYRSNVDVSLLHTSDSALSPPSTPRKMNQTASAPPSPSADGRGRKANTLTDLIDTERSYVDLLAGIIRKVAGAWSRSNLPPPELDAMFRGIESIYKANRSMLSKLKDIGANSSSPKELGDLVMRWIDHIEAPYTAYCEKFCSGFDTWDPVQSNPRLRTVLAMFSSSNPPPLPPSSPAHPAEPLIWSLDELFVLPKTRLKYYRKLYSRLLKGTAPGREDHRLLTGTLDKVEKLLVIFDQRAGVEVGAPRTVAPVQSPPTETEDEVVIDMRTRNSTFPPPQHHTGGPLPPPPQRTSNSTHGSSSSADRQSEDTAPTSEDHMPASTLSMPIMDLERRLSTERTLDIFTMKPKQVRLQISPPSLPFTRELRFSADVMIRFTPQSTGVEVVQELGHVFILTDLLLICERMTPRERSRWGPDGPDMWLSYPPLAGKHLRVAPSNESSTILTVTILRKEVVTLYAGSPGVRERLVAEFRECIDAAGSSLPSSKNPPPPVPALPTKDVMTTTPSNTHDQSPSPDARMISHVESTSHPSRVLSPSGFSSDRPNDAPSIQSTRSSSASDAPLADSMVRLAMAAETRPEQPAPTQGNPHYPTRSSSRSAREGAHGHGHAPAPIPGPGQLMRGPSFGPGQIVPPQSSRPDQVMPPHTYGPGQVIPPDPSRYEQPPPHMYGPGQVAPPEPLRFEQPRPPPSFSPGQVVSRGREGTLRSAPGLTLDPGQLAPHRTDNGLRSAPPDSGYATSTEGYGRPGLGRSPSGGVPVRPPGPPGPTGFPGTHGPPMGSSYYGSSSNPPSRAPSSSSNQLRKSTSSRSLRSQHDMMSTASAPPMPGYPGDLPPPPRNFLPRTGSSSSLHSLPSQLQAVHSKPLLPSAQMSLRSVPAANSFQDPSPPESPVDERPPPIGPTTTSVTAQMKCKVFLQQQHAQWKSLGTAKLKLYCESPTNVKQLVVEADNKDKTILISTIVLADGVERVGKTGVAVELSDKGRRTGIIYMIQLRNEKSAGGLFDSLIAGSDRAAHRR